ncbi:hypothetical protein Pmani_017698 [Petrolisthes manimaculis]|uniref:Uncharacterized protein n=1 Tax=Petrolisthes manimaculis TaxID=1843537 RepID=A0AAE1U9J8_9EUCA|nr:hypothetical protein Pmani_017698 [Petrolisthes manimaculis]
MRYQEVGLYYQSFSLCYSILFSRFLRGETNIPNPTTVNWILNLHLFLDNLMGLFAGPLTKELGFRRRVFVGVAYKPCFLLLALYFDRRRGLANTFPMAGVCTAQLVGPPLIHYLLNEYTLHGATLILGGIFLNSVVGACLFQPVEWHLKPIQDEEGQEKDTLHTTQQYVQYEEVQGRDTLHTTQQYVQDEEGQEKDTLHTTQQHVQYEEVCKSMLRVCGSVLTDLTILRSPRALIIISGSICSITGYANFQAMVPFAMYREGYTLADSAWCFSIVAAANFISRLVASWLSDYKWFNTRLAYMSGVAIMALSSCVFGFLTRLVWIQVVMCVWGVGVGMVMSLYILLMPEVMGLDNMPAIYGSQSLLLGLSFVFVGPLVGK